MEAKRSGRLETAGMVAAFGLLLWMEHRRNLRNPVESKERRVARNLGVAGVSAVLTHFAERPVSVPLAKLVETRRLGLLQRLSLPEWLETLSALLLLDYTLYLWHVLEHRVPVLWRFHAVHHVDLDLDASTALRFHFGELAASIPWRAAQILVDRRDATHSRRLPADVDALHPFPPFQRADFKPDGGMVEPDYHDSAPARDSSLGRTR